MAQQNNLSPDQILQEAIRIIGYKPVGDHADRNGWVTFWCPFHDDIGQKGHSGRPNFRLNVRVGNWTCFVCGAKGGSIVRLAKELGVDYLPRPIPDGLQTYHLNPVHESPVDTITQALEECRANYLHSPAKIYVRDRGVKPLTAAIYGLGYGVPTPYVNKDTAMSAIASGLVRRSGIWLWAESMVYADPPIGHPTVVNCRYLPDKYLERERPFVIEKNHRTWGNRTVPLGSWRIQPSTRTIVVVEGLFDMLVGAQVIQDRGLDKEICAVYTNGSNIAATMLKWFKNNSRKYDFVLIRDPDAAGEFWEASLTKSLDGQPIMLTPPDQLDPDEAFLSGWWPSGL